MIAIPADQPTLPVEIINHDSFWQTVVAPGLVGTLVGGIFALLGVLVTSRLTTNLERDKWRRETLKQLCSEATIAALDIEHQFKESYTLPDDEAIKPSIRRIHDVVETLRLIDAIELARVCERMYDHVFLLPLSGGLVRDARKRLEIAQSQPTEYGRIKKTVGDPKDQLAAIKDAEEKRRAENRRLADDVKTQENALETAKGDLSEARADFIAAAQKEFAGRSRQSCRLSRAHRLTQRK